MSADDRDECHDFCRRLECEWCPGHDLLFGDPNAPVHTYPVNDLIEHDTDGGDCACGPTAEPVPRPDGSIGWQMIHHSLDGREAYE